jgi:hypothetical protein
MTQPRQNGAITRRGSPEPRPRYAALVLEASLADESETQAA